jgi:hypothetical protein
MNELSLHRQWASRPADERFSSLTEMSSKLEAQRAISRARTISSRSLVAVPDPDHRGLTLQTYDGTKSAPTHWAFGQLASLVEAPARYLRNLPAELAADCINYGLHVKRGPEDVGILTVDGDAPQLRAATGPNYGRIWNADIVRHLMDRFGDGVAGQWRVPGVFGRRVEVNRDTTTLFAGDRDLFIFLVDEDKRVPVRTRRDADSEGMLYRGFMVSNSEVGSGTLSVRFFAYDGICGNRIIWGAQELGRLDIRHTASAPDKFLGQLQPMLESYVESSTASLVDKVTLAQQTRVDDLEKFLGTRFGPRVAERIVDAHQLDEHRPMETIWDVVTGVTAYARSIPHQGDRVEVEEVAGKILEAA